MAAAAFQAAFRGMRIAPGHLLSTGLAARFALATANDQRVNRSPATTQSPACIIVPLIVLFSFYLVFFVLYIFAAQPLADARYRVIPASPAPGRREISEICRSAFSGSAASALYQQRQRKQAKKQHDVAERVALIMLRS